MSGGDSMNKKMEKNKQRKWKDLSFCRKGKAIKNGRPGQ